jgi:Na+/H+-dicarboxylate symporter
MPITLKLLLMILACLLFAIAAVGVPSGRFSIIAAGLACWSLAEILV